jgi:hypothetical protein
VARYAKVPYFYGMTKAALNLGMAALGADLQSRGVVVAVISPGQVDTEMLSSFAGEYQAKVSPITAADSPTAPAGAPKTMADVLAASKPSDWRPLDPENTLYMELASGRVVQGIELLSSLPRGGGPLGFYEHPSERVPIRSVRVAADIPEAQRSRLEVLRTDTRTFTALIESRRNRGEEWYQVQAGRIDVCNIPLPVRSTSAVHEAHCYGPHRRLYGVLACCVSGCERASCCALAFFVWHRAIRA